MKNKLELYYSMHYPPLSKTVAEGLLSMHGYPPTEKSKRGYIAGRYKVKDGETALNHALVIKQIAQDMKCASIVGVRVMDNARAIIEKARRNLGK